MSEEKSKSNSDSDLSEQLNSITKDLETLTAESSTAESSSSSSEEPVSFGVEPFEVIAAVDIRSGGLSYNGNTVWPPMIEDNSIFERLTNSGDPRSPHVVVMGRKTWEDLPESSRPMSNRINIVLSANHFNDTERWPLDGVSGEYNGSLIDIIEIPEPAIPESIPKPKSDAELEQTMNNMQICLGRYYIVGNITSCLVLIKELSQNMKLQTKNFVIGGGQTFNSFMSEPGIVSQLRITEVDTEQMTESGQTVPEAQESGREIHFDSFFWDRGQTGRSRYVESNFTDRHGWGLHIKTGWSSNILWAIQEKKILEVDQLTKWPSVPYRNLIYKKVSPELKYHDLIKMTLSDLYNPRTLAMDSDSGELIYCASNLSLCIPMNDGSNRFAWFATALSPVHYDRYIPFLKRHALDILQTGTDATSVGKSKKGHENETNKSSSDEGVVSKNEQKKTSNWSRFGDMQDFIEAATSDDTDSKGKKKINKNISTNFISQTMSNPFQEALDAFYGRRKNHYFQHIVNVSDRIQVNLQCAPSRTQEDSSDTRLDMTVTVDHADAIHEVPELAIVYGFIMSIMAQAMKVNRGVLYFNFGYCTIFSDQVMLALRITKTVPVFWPYINITDTFKDLSKYKMDHLDFMKNWADLVLPKE